MNYTIHQLQVFLKVTETQSITKAATELFMTQPAASIQLKKFQDQFDVPLTEVIGRQLRVTDFGWEIAEMASRVMAELENIKFKTAEYHGLITGRLTVYSASTGKYVIPFFLSDFLKAHAGVDLILDVTNKTRVVESLKYGETDFALVSVLPEDLSVEEELLVENKLYLVGNHPERDPDAPLIYREEGSATRKVMEQYFANHDSKNRKRMELTSNEAVKQAVMAGLGYSIMPLIGIHHELTNGQLFLLEADGLPIQTDWRLIWLKGKKLSPVSLAFLDYIRENKTEIVNEHFGWMNGYNNPV